MKLRKFLPLIGIIIFILIAVNLNFNSIVEQFTNINPLYSIFSFFAFIPIVLMTNIQWQVLLKKHKIKMSFIASFKNILIGYFFGFITPGGLGAYTRTLYMQDDTGEPLEKCLSNVIINNTIDYIALLLIGVIGGLFLSSIYPYFFLIIVIVLLIELFLFFSLLQKESWRNILKRLFQSKFFNPFRDRLHNSIDAFFENMPKPKDIILPFSISFIGWIVRFAILFIISKLFFIDVPFIYFIFIIAIGDIFALWSRCKRINSYPSF